MTRKLIAGNWKMNGLAAQADVLDAVIAGVGEPECDVVVCPPVTLLSEFARRAEGSTVAVGAQDCHPAERGAHTGDVSAEMLADAGASHVILGHSERRADHGEGDALVHAKAEAAQRAGLAAIVCVGETAEARDAGRAVQIVTGQMRGSLPDVAVSEDQLIVAYEPVWAIGTGRTPSTGHIEEMHAAMRAELEMRYGGHVASRIRLLYGGSVKATNAAEILGCAGVDGALVGGASLTAEGFLPIVAAAG